MKIQYRRSLWNNTDFLSIADPTGRNSLSKRRMYVSSPEERFPRRPNRLFINHLPERSQSLRPTVRLRSDWNQERLHFMETIVFAKFAQNPNLKRLLKQTADCAQIEKNTWNDRFWGTNLHLNGLNHLSRILEKVRKSLCHAN